MKKALGVIAIIILIMVVGYVGLAITSSSSCSRNEVDKMPAIKRPYYMITTVPPGLIYAGKTVEELGDRVNVESPYYVKINGKWQMRSGALALMRVAYKEIKVVLLSAP